MKSVLKEKLPTFKISYVYEMNEIPKSFQQYLWKFEVWREERRNVWKPVMLIRELSGRAELQGESIWVYLPSNPEAVMKFRVDKLESSNSIIILYGFSYGGAIVAHLAPMFPE